MINIPLQALPNQSLSIQLDQINYDISIATCGLSDNSLIMAVTLFINNVLILSGIRAVAGFPVIPYDYLQNGNFVFVTANDEYPIYTRFGIDQFLIYASPDEIAEIDAGTFVVSS